MIALLPLSGKKFQNFRSWPMDYESHGEKKDDLAFFTLQIG